MTPPQESWKPSTESKAVGVTLWVILAIIGIPAAIALTCCGITAIFGGIGQFAG